jgi:hypothetical protein
MAKPLEGNLPPDLDLDAGYTIQFAAIDPTTGAAVAGVNVTTGTLLVTNVAGGDLTPPDQTEPLWIPLPAVPLGG